MQNGTLMSHLRHHYVILEDVYGKYFCSMMLTGINNWFLVHMKKKTHFILMFSFWCSVIFTHLLTSIFRHPPIKVKGHVRDTLSGHPILYSCQATDKNVDPQSMSGVWSELGSAWRLRLVLVARLSYHVMMYPLPFHTMSWYTVSPTNV